MRAVHSACMCVFEDQQGNEMWGLAFLFFFFCAHTTIATILIRQNQNAGNTISLPCIRLYKSTHFVVDQEFFLWHGNKAVFTSALPLTCGQQPFNTSHFQAVAVGTLCNLHIWGLVFIHLGDNDPLVSAQAPSPWHVALQSAKTSFPSFIETLFFLGDYTTWQMSVLRFSFWRHNKCK